MRFAKVRTTDTVIGDTAAATRDTDTGAAADSTLSPNCAHRARHGVSIERDNPVGSAPN